MIQLNRQIQLTYDDVLLLPKYSEVLPTETMIEVKLHPKINLKIPVFSSAMDTVTEWKMALEMSLIGGMGIIHKNMSIQDQSESIKKLKNYDITISKYKNPALDVQKKLLAGAAVGVNALDRDRVTALAEAGADLIVIDTAHGHSKGVAEQLNWIKKYFPHLVIAAGNVATPEGTNFLIDSGADIIKIGIGPGSICTTRLVAGVGVPQFEAVLACAEICQKHNKSSIADGGLRSSGDIVKALAGGATVVMMGSTLAGTAESPGEKLVIDGKKYKAYRGMGSIGAMIQGSKDRYGQSSVETSQKLVPEGIAGLVPYKGPVEKVLYQLMGGLKAGMGYLGAKNLVELKERAHFITISSSAKIESAPHSVQSPSEQEEEE